MRIIQKDGYHYLVHSFRKDGKIITKEKYLGKEVPADIEIVKEDFLRECMRDSIFTILDKIKNGFRREWNSFPLSVKREMLIDLSVGFTYNTNAIEGSTLTLEDTEELIKMKILGA